MHVVLALQNAGPFLKGRTYVWISVNKDYGVTGAMIFLVEIYATRVFIPDINEWR